MGHKGENMLCQSIIPLPIASLSISVESDQVATVEKVHFCRSF